jgi:hypothetical protein
MGHFDGSRASCDNAAGSSNHGCMRWEDEPSSSLLAAYCPWQSSHKCLPRYWQLDTAQKGNTPKWVCGHCLVCLRELKLMHLGMCKEDDFGLLLCRG